MARSPAVEPCRVLSAKSQEPTIISLHCRRTPHAKDAGGWHQAGTHSAAGPKFNHPDSRFRRMRSRSHVRMKIVVEKQDAHQTKSTLGPVYADFCIYVSKRDRGRAFFHV